MLSHGPDHRGGERESTPRHYSTHVECPRSRCSKQARGVDSRCQVDDGHAADRELARDALSTALAQSSGAHFHDRMVAAPAIGAWRGGEGVGGSART
jgi:hypothetical protein